MAALSTNSLVFAGTAPAFVQAAASDTAEVGNGRNTFVVYRNTNASPRTVTITLPTGNTPYTEATPATVTFALAATTGERWIPLHPDYAGSDGRVTLALSDTTNVSVAVVRTDWVV